jgi:signal transduction histidine kinase
LTELNQIKANLISNVSHELRTPMAHIKGYVELMIDAQLGPLEEEQVSALKVVQRSTERLERLLNDLIEFSMSSREGVGLNLEGFKIEKLLQKVLKRSSTKATKAEIELIIDVTDPLPMVRGDPERLGWVLNQFVDNGIKFTPSGGKVTLKAAQEGDQIVVSVQDTGIGIPTERREEIFLPFHQLDGSTKRAYPGTGLGLALVKLILDAHGAEITVTGEEGKGSTFSFNLPKHQLFA